MPGFTWLFLIFLAAGTATQLWLAARQRASLQAHRARVPEPFARQITLAAHQRAADYGIDRMKLETMDVLLGALLSWAWTLGGGLELLDHAWHRTGLEPVFAGTAIIISFVLASGLLDLPLALYRTFVIEHRYGFNRMTPRIFVNDQLKQMALVVALGTPLGWTLLYLMERSGTLWWLYAWVVWMSFTVLFMWAYPVFIAPLFNRFTALEDTALKERIVHLLEHNGFSSDGVYIMDGSRRSGHGNAYFTGLGRAKRIVFFDTLLRTLNTEEIEAVLAHELGHFKYHHVRKQLFASTAIALAGFALVGWFSQQEWFYHGLGIKQPSTYMALLLFIIASPVFAFALRPISSYWRRRHEFEADNYAAGHTNPGALIDALVNLYKDNAATLTPDPLYSAYHDSHPPAPVRIAHLHAKLAQPQA